MLRTRWHRGYHEGEKLLPTKHSSSDGKISHRLTRLLKGKMVRSVKQLRPSEVLIEFHDGTRFYVDRTDIGFELSITDGPNHAEAR